MFVLYHQEKQRLPVKIWLKKPEDLEPECQAQALNLANLPFAFRQVALMPDTHAGYGMPIGGVLACEGAIIPNAVGVDIGCGMGFIHTNIPAALIKTTGTPNGKLAQLIVGAIMREIPVGFAHHQTAQNCAALDRFAREGRHREEPKELLAEIDAGYYQAGTLGGGNHFIELQEDDDGYLGLMLHSGSRNFGYQICHYFNRAAKEFNRKFASAVRPEWDLAFLPTDSDPGRSYIEWMNLALEFAMENRQLMMERVKRIVFHAVAKHAGFSGAGIDLEVNAHHNYAALERHFGQSLWIHRKGAIRVRAGEPGIIPGAMGSYSYIVEGLGNPESFQSCSHGAGRKMGRKEAERRFKAEEVLADLKQQDVVLGTPKRNRIADESRWAYKEIDQVIENERDLVRPVMRLKTVAVVKG